MKKAFKIILLLIAIVVAGAVIYWQFNKKRIVKNALENVIGKKTDSLYFISYDSSMIDAINGNASFYNVQLQSDSLQKLLLQSDTISTTDVYNIHVGEVSIRGAKIPSLLTNEKVEARSIRILRPVVYITERDTNITKTFRTYDTLAIYEKILGKFKSIKADEIIIEDAQLHFSKKSATPYLSLNDIDISVRNVLIDSTKNYNNLVSYFIKDIHATVLETVYKDRKNNFTLQFSKVEYNAARKFIKVDNFKQKDDKTERLIFDINNTIINELNTDSFILISQLKAGELSSDGGLMTFYRKQGSNDTDEGIELDNDFFNEALLNKIALGKTNIYIYNRKKPEELPLKFDNVQFAASEIQSLYSGTNLRNLISRSNWVLSADGFSFLSDDKIYKMEVGAFNIIKAEGAMNIRHFKIIPQVSNSSFVKGLKVQKDLYEMSIKNISLTGIDTKRLIADKMLFARAGTMQPVIKIFNDRTVRADTTSKVGKAPHQLWAKMKLQVYVKRLAINNGLISYTERGAASEQKGTVFFSNLNGTMDNVTNIKEFLSRNNSMVFNLNSRFMGVSNLQTKWILPIDSDEGKFSVTGYAGAFNAEDLTKLTEPLALVSIKKGKIKSLNFNIYGDDLEAMGTVTLLYNDLKVEALKKDSNDLKKRNLLSFVANLLIQNDNPKNRVIRKGEIELERDKTRSFFNLLWKGIFKGVKRIAIGKNDK